ncbi:alpha/beta fold hydrolase [Spiribacter sp. C176]|uniref:Alpha/beta fold hydrolase n=1 Tax=Spiribacter salilacus TaxID=2664894 RepID=A0A6N7QVM2_9GAMM|nr:alpha/beta fold hydrolase [Spiribacter salilacus]MRH78367.1 alpha/beta fold hydrolase [Spiribacter salilacus]
MSQPAILLHGLYGSGNNWRSIARRFEKDYTLYTPDLRCHGRAPHHPDMRYTTLAADIIDLLDKENIDQAKLVGHSMGGKVAMATALLEPTRVSGLMVVDIAPVTYDHSREHGSLINAMQALDLTAVNSREDADQALSKSIPNTPVRQFLLTNLVRQDNQWAWRLPLDILADQLPELQDWPASLSGRQWDGPAHFVYGGQSDYVLPSSHATIRQFFPAATLHCIDGVGHWVHAEKPDAFATELHSFLTGKHHVRGL